MKVLILFVVAVSSVSARGSGPYLPSGWRPEGPAFFLPGEVQAKPSDNPLKETLFQESEASGSDFLREYGPPKVQEVSQDITQQGLPDVATEQSFVAIEAKFNQEVVNEEIKEAVHVTEKEATVVTEAIAELSSTPAEEPTTEAQVVEVTTELSNEEEEELIQGRAVKLEIEASISDTTDFVDAAVVTESNLIENQQINSEINNEVRVENLQENENSNQVTVNNEVKTEVLTQGNVEGNVKILKEVNNIAEKIVKIEHEIAEEQNVEGSGVKSIQISGSLEQVPEGFLEYGPPGFREYGPPKGDEVLRSSALQQQSEAQVIENNETRRRRFSPKFRTSKKN